MFKHQIAAPAPIPWRSTWHVAHKNTSRCAATKPVRTTYDGSQVGLGRPEPTRFYRHILGDASKGLGLRRIQVPVGWYTHRHRLVRTTRTLLAIGVKQSSG
jgi:hypothetical protein